MKYRILIIEDDKFFRNIVTHKFEESDLVEVDFLENGKGAVEKIKKYTPDLVLLDLLMPDVGGYETLKAVRFDEDVKDTPIIILSNLSKQEDIDKCKAYGSVDFMVKAMSSPQEIVDRTLEFLEGKAK